MLDRALLLDPVKIEMLKFNKAVQHEAVCRRPCTADQKYITAEKRVQTHHSRDILTSLCDVDLVQ